MSRPPGRSPQRQPPGQAGGGGGGRGGGSGGGSGGGRPVNRMQHELHLLFDRPIEPAFFPKGEERAVFDIPSEYIIEEYRPAREGLANRIKDEMGESIPVKRITIPDGSALYDLDRRDNFSLFIPKHRRLAGLLIDILVGMRTYDDLLAASIYFRDRVNPYMFNYALSVAMLHRADTRNIKLPSLVESFPDKFVNAGTLRVAREVSGVQAEGERRPIVIPRDYSASDREAEHRVAYFREDLGINLHHWHWHLVYPFEADLRIVNKDRRGELFYYMHQQIVSRYNFERLCNGMSRVERLTSLRDPIPQGYFPKLDSLVSSRVWIPRHSNATLNDVYREIDQIKFDLSDLERWRDRLLDSIAQGSILDENGSRVDLDEYSGIDILGNLVESSRLSRNRNYYGDFHNFGHLAISLCHDPDGRHLETFGVMGDSTTAMRDPVFYRWHAYVDYIFQQHKNTLPPYTEQVLDFPGVRVTGVEINGRGNKNELYTFWAESDVDLSRGMDFSERGSVYARFTHLQHQNFTYRITVENSSGQSRGGTVRIFLAPKLDERGLPMLLTDQRHLFIELDKFPVTLKNKTNVIERESTESSVTIPFEATFRDLRSSKPTSGARLEEFNLCGCGWPQHMLIPRGSPAGYECQLFVMISNIEGDRVQQSSKTQDGECKSAASYCGIRDDKYPDRRPMGFPFDRNPRANSDTLSLFLTPNMSVTDVKIIFQDTSNPRQLNQIKTN